MKKRGQSPLIVIILLTLIVMVIITIFANVINIFLQKSEEEIGIEPFILGANIKSFALITKFEETDPTKVKITIHRPSGEGELEGIRFIFEDLSSNTYQYEDRDTSLEEIETKDFYVTSGALGISDFNQIKKVSVAYIFKRSGKERITHILDSLVIRDSSGTISSSGDVLRVTVLNPVLSVVKIDDAAIGPGDDFDEDSFGYSVANIGDLNGDGIPELAVGEPGRDLLSPPNDRDNKGAVWILFLNSEGVLQNTNLIESQTSFDYSQFGSAVANLGDLDGDGDIELAVGEQLYGGEGRVQIISVSKPNGDFVAGSVIPIEDSDLGVVFNGRVVFGKSVANIGDLDNDGVTDIAVGASDDDDGGQYSGSVYIIFLNSDGSVKGNYKINEAEINEVLDGSFFGCAVAGIGDLDLDGNEDIAVGGLGNDDGATSNGAVWILFLNSDGSVKSKNKISEPIDFRRFGRSVANMGDLNGDGVVDLAVGLSKDPDADPNDGLVWIVFLDRAGNEIGNFKITESTLGVPLNGMLFGNAVANMGDIDGNGENDLAVGESMNRDYSGDHDGVTWILRLQ